MSGVQILFVINMKLQIVRLGTAKIYFLKKKRILNTALIVEDWLMFNNNFHTICLIKLVFKNDLI